MSIKPLFRLGRMEILGSDEEGALYIGTITYFGDYRIEWQLLRVKA